MRRPPRSLLFPPARTTGRVLYGVGMAKSGTHSLAALFATHHRARHEPEARRMIELLLADLGGGRREHAALRRYVVGKGRRLGLDVDASQMNGHVVELLGEAFPAAGFVLTVRSPSAYLGSATRHAANREASPHWVAWRDARLRAPFRPEDEPLARRGLHPVDGYLRAWARHHDRVLDAVHPSRLLILRTEDLGRRLEELAAFAGTDPASLDTEGAHTFPGVGDRPLDEVDPDYVAARVDELCRATVDRLADAGVPVA